LKGLLNPDAGDKEGTAKAIKESGGTKADTDAVEARVKARADSESNTVNFKRRRDRANPNARGLDVRFGVISDDRIAAIRQEEAQKQLDEVRKRNLAKASEKALIAAAG
jgi:hypothetical protein